MAEVLKKEMIHVYDRFEQETEEQIYYAMIAPEEDPQIQAAIEALR